MSLRSLVRSRRRGLAGAAVAALAAALLPAGAALAAPSCTAEYQIANEWGTGFIANVTLTNTGDPLPNGWELTWSFDDGQRVTNGWNGVYSQSGSNVRVTNPSWDNSLNTNETVSLGFQGTRGATNSVPTDFALNGVACNEQGSSAPVVELTAPADGSAFLAGQPIQLAADASDADGSIDRVEFRADGTVLGSDTTAPYTYNWQNAAVGQYSVTAVAFDDSGESAASLPIAIEVLDGPAVVANPSTLSIRQGDTGTFDVTLASAPSGTVTVDVARTQGSADLSVADGDELTFTATNWDDPQEVTIASADNGGDSASATFTASAPGHDSAVVQAREVIGASVYEAEFLEQYNKIKDPDNGYFREFAGGLVPYHSVETLIVEAPDHGHATTSEAFSYYLWLEAAYGRVTEDWGPFNDAWASMEEYIIPETEDQPTNGAYDPGSPATYAAEYPHPSEYPSLLQPSVPVGDDPLANELSSTYGTDEVYAMHWLLDVDNTYGYGFCGDGSDDAPAFINTFQRGSHESVWETVPHPSCETFEHGGQNGFVDLFTDDASYAEQWRYTNAPDADARAVQVALLAHTWAEEQGQADAVAESVSDAAMMGDYLRYAMYDKYFKEIGDCVGPTQCPAGTGKNSAHYLMSWYFAWGGATNTSAPWAWRIGSSASHQGYQNPLAAYALSEVPELRPESPTGAQDWATSMDRQLEFLQWLQSSEGGIAGGATNSWQGSYSQPPADAANSQFYGMYYDWQPVWNDPPSNRWFGFQVWQMERTAQLYQMTGDERAGAILDRWVPWAIANTEVGTGGDFAVPADMEWSGTPDTWEGTYTGNPDLHVDVVSHGQDVGVAAALAKTLLYYAEASGDAEARTVGEGLLDALLEHTDDLGIATEETRTDYGRFDDEYQPGGDGLYIPPGWTGEMANGDPINSDSTFLSIRSFYEDDPAFPELEAYLNGTGEAPTFTYHRFWAQVEIATAFAAHDELFGDAG
ncbi:glycoside hydrolase family 48 protein [Allonocardiopsis opalescens]|uniref:Cellulose 1,4-beta-cellobiosidase n=1 Tax=Allonocardiopsis opalescens TaxID=1144618 RepID=A0A2T0QFB7_9ACTN|nr:glycoside hydrolase family 48 protein [Allonocardiopsis opalescens]PRY02619.1 cellulose 1,4-beta-cellobiosidase [Allonocardiopsis opalescens]